MHIQVFPLSDLRVYLTFFGLFMIYWSFSCIFLSVTNNFFKTCEGGALHLIIPCVLHASPSRLYRKQTNNHEINPHKATDTASHVLPLKKK